MPQPSRLFSNRETLSFFSETRETTLLSIVVRIFCLSCVFVCVCGVTWGQSPKDLKLKDYRPRSIYKVPQTTIARARFPVIDMHSHDYAQSQAEIDLWVKTMDKYGIQKTIILSGATGSKFDSVVTKYSRYPTRFDIWCGFDYTGYDTNPNWTRNAIKELERCHQKGARGIGEIADKGTGLLYSNPVTAKGMHMDDARMKPLIQKCGELNMPINFHVAEPYWMYLPADSTNDGLMNAYTWRINKEEKGILLHEQLMQSLENAVRDNPKTTFIACHFANCEYDLSIIGRMLDKYPNLYADIAARYGETATIPRYMQQFYTRYQNKLLYGTDMGFEDAMYQITFRILESADDHFYEHERFGYHWAYYGFALPDGILKKLYADNARKVLK